MSRISCLIYDLELLRLKQRLEFIMAESSSSKHSRSPTRRHREDKDRSHKHKSKHHDEEDRHRKSKHHRERDETEEERKERKRSKKDKDKSRSEAGETMKDEEDEGEWVEKGAVSLTAMYTLDGALNSHLTRNHHPTYPPPMLYT
jgi:hypothetical protein